MKGWRDEGMKGWRDEGMKGWREEGMKGGRKEGMKGWGGDEGMEKEVFLYYSFYLNNFHK